MDTKIPFIKYFELLERIMKSLVIIFAFLMALGINPLNQCCCHIETSQLICYANQLTGFYIRATLV